MKNLKTLQFFLVVVMFLCFVLFLYNFITHVSYILPLVIMIIAFIGTMILSIIINKMDFDYKRLIKYENEDKIRIEAINLYTKLSFKVIDETETRYKMKRENI